MTGIPEPGHLEAVLSEHGRLLALARKLLGDEHAAEDVVQDALLQSWSAGNSTGKGLRALLQRMVRHRVMDRRKTDRRRQAREAHVAIPEAVPSPDEMLAREQLRRHVAEAVLELDAPYRAAVWLRYFEGLSARQVAERLAVPLDTVRTRLRRALDQLRGKLDRRYGDRRAWATVLSPVMGTAATAVLGGLLIMNKAHLAFFAAGVLLLSVAAWAAWAGADATPPVEGDAVPRLVADSPSPEVPGETASARREVPAEVSPGTGTLLHADGTPAAGVPFWSWGERRPRWTQRPEAPILQFPPPSLEDPHGRTDDQAARMEQAGAAQPQLSHAALHGRTVRVLLPGPAVSPW